MKTSESSDGFTAFYEATRDRVFRAVLLARGGELEGSEDAVASAYEKAFLRWDKVSAHPNPVAWVIRTAINQRISTWRRHRHGDDGSYTATWPQGSRLDPHLVELIRRLPQRQREVLALRVLLDFSTEQTADTLGMKQGTVKTQLHRALKSLRLQLGSHEAKEVLQ
jgi:DNA-directed RNA polymerase specialized sigma24 family protein